VAIATSLKSQLDAAHPNFTITQYGPVLHVVRVNAADFTIFGEDGLGGTAMLVIKDKVESFDQLPRVAKEGFVVEVTGLPETEHDNYWRRFEARGTSDVREGVWIETLKPGELVALDSSKMPHVLVREGAVVELITADQGTPDDSSYPVTVAGAGSTFIMGLSGTEGTTNDGTTVQITPAGAVGVWFVWFPVSESSVSSNNEIQVTATYDIDPTSLESYTGVVELYYSDGAGGYQLSTQQIYSAADGILTDETLTHTRKWGSTEDIRFRMVVNCAIGSSAGYTINWHSSDNAEPGIQMALGDAVKVNFGSTNFFVTGTSVTVRVTATGQAQSTATINLSSDETGTALGTLMQVPLNALTNITATDNADGTVTLVDSGGTPTVDLIQTGHDESIHLISSGMGLASGYSLAGRTIRNLTDDSSGVIGSNTSMTLTLSTSLAGGTDNNFNVGDEVNVFTGAGAFTFRPAVWEPRKVGTLQEGRQREADDEIKKGTNPWPSFVNRKIRDVFYHKGRLGVVADENVILSRAGGLFNFFRKSVQDFLDSDPIDVQVTTPDVAIFQAVTQWNKELFLWSEQAQFVLRGEPLLTPKTASLKLASRYEVTPRVRPWVSGEHQYFMTYRTGYTEIMEYYQNRENDTYAARSITKHVPGLIAGNPIQIVGSEQFNMLAVLAGGDQRNVYVYNFLRDPERLVQAAWSRWRFNPGATVLGIFFQDDKFGVIKKQADGVFLDTMEIDPTAVDAGFTGRYTYLDRRARQNDTGYSVDYNVTVAGQTCWTLPFDVATDGSEGTLAVVKQQSGDTIPTATRTATSTIYTGNGTDYSGTGVYIGLLYDSEYTFSELHLREEDGFGRRDGRLTIRNMNIAYQDTMDLDINVNPLNSCDITYALDSTQPGIDGEKYVPVGQRTSDVTITLKSTGHGPFTALSAWWDGMYHNRARKIR
jgi:hypothetical protein